MTICHDQVWIKIRCGTCEDCKLRLRGNGDEETTMSQATALMTIWPRVALFNYFAVPMPFADTATARRLPLDWTSSLRGGECYSSAAKPEDCA